MNKKGFASLVALGFFCAQPLTENPVYSISNIPLPAEMDKQVCISGLSYANGSLFFASERCPLIIISEPTTGKITGTYRLEVPQNFEMEGMTAYDNKLYLVSENVAALYEYDPSASALRQVDTGEPLPPKTKNGDGMEGVAASSQHGKFYLLRERNENMSRSQIFTYAVVKEGGILSLRQESMIELPLETPQWRYSDIYFDASRSRLMLLKSFSKGKMRRQFIESINTDEGGKLLAETLKDIPVENFSMISSQYKDQDYSMNLEGITMDEQGNIFVVSDNTSGKAACDEPAREKTILLMLKKNEAAKD